MSHDNYVDANTEIEDQALVQELDQVSFTGIDPYEAMKLRAIQNQNVKFVNRTHGRHSRSSASNRSAGDSQRLKDAYTHHASRNRVRDAVSHFMNSEDADLSNLGQESLPHSSSSLSGSYYRYNDFHKKQPIDVSGVCAHSDHTVTQKSYTPTDQSHSDHHSQMIRKKFIRWMVCDPQIHTETDILRIVQAYESATLCSEWYLDMEELNIDEPILTESDNGSTSGNKTSKRCVHIVFKDPTDTARLKKNKTQHNIDITTQGTVDSFFKYNDDVYFIDKGTITNRVPTFYRCPMSEISNTTGMKCSEVSGSNKKRETLKILEYIVNHGVDELGR